MVLRDSMCHDPEPSGFRMYHWILQEVCRWVSCRGSEWLAPLGLLLSSSYSTFTILFTLFSLLRLPQTLAFSSGISDLMSDLPGNVYSSYVLIFNQILIPDEIINERQIFSHYYPPPFPCNSPSFGWASLPIQNCDTLPPHTRLFLPIYSTVRCIISTSQRKLYSVLVPKSYSIYP